MRQTFLVVLLLLVPAGVMAQSAVELEAFTDFELWPDHDRDFQHRIHAGSQAGIHIWGMHATAGMSLLRYIKHSSKADGLPFQGEATKVWGFRHALTLSRHITFKKSYVEIGLWAGRRAIQWVDRDCECYHNRFPVGHKSAREVLEENGSREKDPGIAYHDGLRPRLVVFFAPYDIRLKVLGPAYRWHEVTLPYPRWIFNVEYSPRLFFAGDLKLGTHSEMSGLIKPTTDLFAYWMPVEGMQFGVRYGRIPHPGYRDPLQRVSFSLRIQIEYTNQL